jgi:hypothetical protein
MKFHWLLVILTCLCTGCSQYSPNHLPDSAYYKQQEAELLEAICGQIMTHKFFLRPTTKLDTIVIYDSLSFPSPLSEQEVTRLIQEYKVAAGFIALLTDTSTWSQLHALTVAPPARRMAARVAFMPQLITHKDECFACYRLSRAVFNEAFSRAYFQVQWIDPAEGVNYHVLCQKEGGKWVVKLLEPRSSFKL